MILSINSIFVFGFFFVKLGIGLILMFFILGILNIFLELCENFLGDFYLYYLDNFYMVDYYYLVVTLFVVELSV